MSAPEAFRELPPDLGNSELAGWCRSLAQPVAMTGATGFVGSHLVRALIAGGVRPRLLVRDVRRAPEELRPDAEFVTGDLGDDAALAELVAGSATIFHLAGVVRASSAAAFERANRAGTSNLVKASSRVAPAARLVHVSSLAAAGPSPRPQGRRPDEPERPISAYGRSKLGGERAVREASAPWVILRPPAIYGPRDIDVLQFFRLAARGLVPLPSGERWVTMAHVADVVRAVLAAAGGSVDGRVLHLGEPHPHLMGELVRTLAEAGRVRARVIAVPGPLVRMLGLGGDLLHAVGFEKLAMTSDKARELLARHWSADTAGSLSALGLDGCVPFATGAASTWDWYRRHGWLPPAC